jgi:hypothetical protein
MAGRAASGSAAANPSAAKPQHPAREDHAEQAQLAQLDADIRDDAAHVKAMLTERQHAAGIRRAGHKGQGQGKAAVAGLGPPAEPGAGQGRAARNSMACLPSAARAPSRPCPHPGTSPLPPATGAALSPLARSSTCRTLARYNRATNARETCCYIALHTSSPWRKLPVEFGPASRRVFFVPAIPGPEQRVSQDRHGSIT